MFPFEVGKRYIVHGVAGYYFVRTGVDKGVPFLQGETIVRMPNSLEVEYQLSKEVFEKIFVPFP